MSDSENVIPFPRPPLSPEDAPRRALVPEAGMLDDAGMPVTECEGVIHVFADLPGRCQCGEEFWEGPEEPPIA